MMKRFTPLLFVPSLLLAQEQEQKQPNIVVFLIDDMGVMDTSVPFMVDENGNPRSCPLNDWYRTPNMERLANQGVRFNSFYAQSVSSPSRASILTGQNSARHRTTNWISPTSKNTTPHGPKAWNWEGLTKSDVTLPKVLQSAGYKTIHIGKAHYGPVGSEGEDPKNIGFDANVGGCAIGHPGSYYGEDGYGHIKGAKSHAVPHLEKYHGTDAFLTDALTQEAKREVALAVEQDKPFFLNMCHYAVHAPFMLDKRYVDHYKGKDKSERAIAFATLIEGMDKSLGDLMDYFEELGIAENTFIVFLGDNGSDAPLGKANECTSAAPLRGKKGTEYEGGVRIPFIAGWGKNSDTTPAQKRTKIDAGKIQLQQATIMDLFPTLLAIADVDMPKGHIYDGYNITTQLAGKKDRKREEQILMHFPHAHNCSYFTTYKDEEWKLIYEYSPKTPTEPRYRLFNLSVDLNESNDLSSAEPKKLKKMIEKMVKQLDREGALYPQDVQGKELRPIVP